MMGAGTRDAVTVAEGEAVLAMELEGELEGEGRREGACEGEGGREGEREGEGGREGEREGEVVREGETGEAVSEGVSEGEALALLEEEALGTKHCTRTNPAVGFVFSEGGEHSSLTTTPKLEL
jgi:hypothetical protein